ncbi:unnamed protein product [Heligmosomoides polygyrus]|uniref:PINc domain-containing protein n=1 Tax=Heligmosomoides polygyrus TaxID=6339 RepID=A0A183G487_HELPZ|nr:unnamed protein product [Heligmosomoides polygyrus]
MHPLVNINISEHWTRITGAKPRQTSTEGIWSSSRQIRVEAEMVNPFKLCMFATDGYVTFIKEFLRQRLSQYKEVFPELDAVGDELKPDELLLHLSFAVAMDCPLLVKMNPTVDSQAKRNVPVNVFFQPTDSASLVRARASKSCLCRRKADASGWISAVGMLLDRIEIICNYPKGVQEGRFPPNDEIIREANKRNARAAMLLARMTEICRTLSSLQTKTTTLGTTITAWRRIALLSPLSTALVGGNTALNGHAIQRESMYSWYTDGLACVRFCALFGYHWLTRSHLPMLLTYATCTVKCYMAHLRIINDNLKKDAFVL